MKEARHILIVAFHTVRETPTMHIETLNTASETEISTLSADEIDAISGGVVDGGCIVYPFPIGPGPTFPTDPIEPILW